jgi:branched-chain amino acid transport system substrate-binding protein
MRKHRRIILAITILLVMMAYGLLHSEKAMTAEKVEILKVGVSASLSGPAVAWGLPAYRTVQTQARLYNEVGGVKIGNKVYKIELAVADDQYRAETGAAAINKLIFKDKVDYILIGGPSTFVALAGGPICQKNEVLFLCNGTAGPGLAPELTWVFRPELTNYSRNLAMILWLAKNRPEIKRIAFTVPDNEAGHKDSDIFKKNLEKYVKNWKLVAGEFYKPGEKEYYPILSKVIRETPDLIYTDTATPGDLGLLLKQGRELGYKKAFLQGTTVMIETIASIAGVEACEDLYSPGYSNDVTPELKKLMDEYKKDWGEYNVAVPTMCDFLPLLIQAMQIAGTTNKYKVREVLESATKPGILNSVLGSGARFYEEKATCPGIAHQFLVPIGIIRVHNGKDEILGLYSPDEMIEKIKSAE